MDRDVVKNGKIQRNKFVPKTRLSAKQRANHLDPMEQATIKMAASTTRGANAGSYVFMMASQESQTSSDLEFIDDTPPYGAFTYCLKLVLKSSPNLSVEQAVAEVKKILKDNEFTQIPKAEYSDATRPTKPIIG
jgi:hypothetical protein